MGKFYLGEDVGPHRVSAALVGFAGVLFAIQPSFAAFGVIAIILLGTAVAFAFYILLTRPIAADTSGGYAISHGVDRWLVMHACPAVRRWFPVRPVWAVWPSNIAWIWLLGVGSFATVSHMMMTYALSFALSATLAPLQYFELPVATLFGYLVFDDFPIKLSLFGIAIIIGAGLYMIHRERITAKQLVTERAAPPI